jgi:hypothetical protein
MAAVDELNYGMPRGHAPRGILMYRVACLRGSFPVLVSNGRASRKFSAAGDTDGRRPDIGSNQLRRRSGHDW